MKNIFLPLVLLILVSLGLNAQDQAANNISAGQLNQKFSFSADLLLSQQLRRYNPDLFVKNENGKYVLNYKLIKGSPYEKNTFSFGHVTDEISNKSVNLYLRYNIYNDEIELKASLESGKKTVALLKKHDISCTINGKYYKYASFINKNNKTKDGYLIEIYKGKNYNLYKRLTSTFTPKKIPENSYSQIEPASFSTNIYYYLQKDNKSITYLPSKKKYLIRLFKNNTSLKNLLRHKNSNLKQEGDFLQIVKSLDSSK